VNGFSYYGATQVTAQEKFIQFPKSVYRVVKLLSSPSKEIRESMVNLLLMLSAYRYLLWNCGLVNNNLNNAITDHSEETRQLLISHKATTKFTKLINHSQTDIDILESVAKSISNIGIEGKADLINCQKSNLTIFVECNHGRLLEDGTVIALIDLFTRTGLPIPLKDEVNSSTKLLVSSDDIWLIVPN